MRIANIDDVISIPLEYFKVPYHYHQDRDHLHSWFCSMSMIIKVSTHLSSLMTVTTLTTMITAKNDHNKQCHCFCKLNHSAHQDDHHYTHDRRFCCYITIVARGTASPCCPEDCTSGTICSFGAPPPSPSRHHPHTLLVERALYQRTHHTHFVLKVVLD